MEDEDLDLEFNTDSKGFIRKLFIVDVFRKYGIVYGLIALFFFLCNVIILVPAAVCAGYTELVLLINFLSGGDQSIAECLWAYLGVSVVGIVAIWITIKVCDKVLSGCTKNARTN